MPTSQTSSRSQSSTKSKTPYKKVADKSEVDETLFGSAHKKTKLNYSDVENLTKKKDALILDNSDYEKLKAQLSPPNKAELLETKKKNELKEAAQERINKMKKIDEEKQKNGSFREGESLKKENMLLKRAHEQLDENIDQVKHMNMMCAYAQAATVREKQLEEKKLLKLKEEEDEKKMAEMMEFERQKAVVLYKQREMKRLEDQKKGAHMIYDQIQEREKQRLHEMEKKEMEQQAILEHIEKIKYEEIEEQKKKKEATDSLLKEVAVSNLEQIKLKKTMKQKEVEEDKMISEYLKQKEEKEKQYMEEQQRKKEEKEKEIAHLRAKQQKALDKQAVMDALRAKRIQEEEDRRWRKKVHEESDKKKLLTEDIKNTREKQMMQKEKMLIEQAKIEREMHSKIISHQMEAEEIERLKGEEEQKRKIQNMKELEAQLEFQKTIKLKEVAKVEQEAALEALEKKRKEEKVEKIRQQKLEEMKKQGVPEKYLVELAAKDYKKEALMAAKKKGSAGDAAEKK